MTIQYDFAQYPTTFEYIDTGFFCERSANTSFSDDNGKLLFFTNGIDVYDSSYGLMKNGGNISSLVPAMNHDSFFYTTGIRTQAIYKPNSTDTVFIIGMGGFENIGMGETVAKHLFLTKVCTNANNGFGEVALKNYPLIKNDSLEEFSLIQHANGRDWWLLALKNYSNIYYRFLITPDAVKGPFIQKFGADHHVDIGSRRVSQNGEKYAISTTRNHVDNFQGLILYDFNRCTGLLSNEKKIPMEENNLSYSIMPLCFSPSGRFLYCGIQTQKVIEYSSWQLQFDLQAQDIKASMDTLGGKILVGDPNGWLYFLSTATLAPDGKIYQQNYTDSYNIIEFPDRKGDSCLFRGNVKYGGNPPVGADDNMPSFPNYRLGPIDGSGCDTLGLDNHPVAWFRWDFEDSTQKRECTFTDLSYFEPTTWHWNFGDGSTSSEINPIHLYQNDGVYNVCLIVCNQYSCDTLCQLVNIGVNAAESPYRLDKLLMLPNPASNILMISLQEFTGYETYQIMLTNPMGQTLLSQNFIGGQTTIDVSNLPPGLYYGQVYEHGEIKAVRKIVVAK